MLRYTAPERGILLTIYLTNNRSVTLAQREFRRRFPGRPTPTGETLRRLAARLEETGTTRDAGRRGRPRSSRSAENIAAVAEDVMEAPSTSTRRRATQMGISRRSLQRILVQDLKNNFQKNTNNMSEKPKRPLSDYMIWLGSAREQIKRDNPGIKMTEIAKKGGELWRAMKDKSEWEAKAAQAKEDYEDAVKEFEGKGSKANESSAKKRGKPAEKTAKKSKQTVDSEEEDDEESD